jgi:four helix bundle protein
LVRGVGTSFPNLPRMGNFRKLGTWQRAHKLALQVYRLTKGFPDHERYGLIAQLRRAAVSVVSNIAEGAGRRNDRELARFLSIARGSVRELECQLLLSRDLGYLKSDDWSTLDADSQEVSRMLNALMRQVRATASQLPAPSSQLPAPSS